jgi:hypothetical protein
MLAVLFVYQSLALRKPELDAGPFMPMLLGDLPVALGSQPTRSCRFVGTDRFRRLQDRFIAAMTFTCVASAPTKFE